MLLKYGLKLVVKFPRVQTLRNKFDIKYIKEKTSMRQNTNILACFQKRYMKKIFAAFNTISETTFESLFKMLPDPCRLLTKLQSGDVADAEGLATINLMAETLPKFENWSLGCVTMKRTLQTSWTS